MLASNFSTYSSGWWLKNLSDRYESQLGLLFPVEKWKMFQITNQTSFTWVWVLRPSPIDQANSAGKKKHKHQIQTQRPAHQQLSLLSQKQRRVTRSNKYIQVSYSIIKQRQVTHQHFVTTLPADLGLEDCFHRNVHCPTSPVIRLPELQQMRSLQPEPV